MTKGKNGGLVDGNNWGKVFGSEDPYGWYRRNQLVKLFHIGNRTHEFVEREFGSFIEPKTHWKGEDLKMLRRIHDRWRMIYGHKGAYRQAFHRVSRRDRIREIC